MIGTRGQVRVCVGGYNLVGGIDGGGGGGCYKQLHTRVNPVYMNFIAETISYLFLNVDLTNESVTIYKISWKRSNERQCFQTLFVYRIKKSVGSGNRSEDLWLIDLVVHLPKNNIPQDFQKEKRKLPKSCL